VGDAAASSPWGADALDVELADEGVGLCSRGRFLTFIGVGAAGVTVTGALWPGGADAATSAPSDAQDRKILNFALFLEDLKSEFYADALARGALSGEVRRFAQVAGDHEQAHARFLRKALGSHARPRQTFRFGQLTRDRSKFIPAAAELEELAVAAYNGQAGNLTKPALGAAIKIVSVEGRHAAWIAAIADEEPAPRAADPGIDVPDVTAALKRLQIR
jgi:hypothetical protein